MHFVIKPRDQSFNVVLETAQYQRMWQEHGQRVLQVFCDVTGLEFQQNLITARVYPDNRAFAGARYQAMHLPANSYSPENAKLIVMVHELCHRLLSGNALGTVGLGLVPHNNTSDPQAQEFEHRHTYLFEYDVIDAALGSEYAQLCREQEERSDINGPHYKAWAWAMRMSKAKRQRALKILVAQALPRERWHERDNWKSIPQRDPAAWFNVLVG